MLIANNINEMGCFNDPAWKVCGWWWGGWLTASTYIQLGGAGSISCDISTLCNSFNNYMDHNDNLQRHKSPIKWDDISGVIWKFGIYQFANIFMSIFGIYNKIY